MVYRLELIDNYTVRFMNVPHTLCTDSAAKASLTVTALIVRSQV